TNVILTKTNAFVQDSSLTATLGKVDMDAANTSTIDSVIVSASVALGIGGTVGVGASIGVALARNYIGWDTDASALPVPDFATGDSSKSSFSKSNPLNNGDLVRIDAGARAGDVYKYIGTKVNPDFTSSSQGTQTVHKNQIV